ncbi:MAG: response regulator [Myxococcota bacterium]|nr:response regulator [Myxococcota bacterium]
MLTAPTFGSATTVEPAILIVDDLAQNQFAMEATLEPLGVRVVSASSGEEALRRLLEEDFALIFLDVQMPGLDGLETAALIKQRGRCAHVPIIFVTAIHREESYVSRGYGRGAVDYLMKPVDPEVIRVKASVFLDMYRQAHEQQEQVRTHAVREAQDAFAVAAHELRTPLNAARIQTQLATQQAGSSDQRILRQLQVISGQIDRLVRMVDELFDVSRLRTGRVALHHTRFDLVELAREVVGRLQSGKGNHRHLLSGEASLDITADRDRLDQVLTNLVSNSIRYSPMGGEVEITVRRQEGRAVLSVRDEGLGISPDKLKTIFKPYAQAHRGAFGGLGLGLSIAQDLIHSHGGRIWAESAGLPGLGATFFVELPGLDLQNPATGQKRLS